MAVWRRRVAGWRRWYGWLAAGVALAGLGVSAAQEQKAVSFPTPAGTPGAAQGNYRGFGFPWENNQLGMEHTVPAPWTPVRLADRRISVWGRTFAFRTGKPWPEEITSAGQAVLARPLEVRVKTDAGAVTWKGEATLSQAAEDAAQIRWQGREAGMEITVASSIEFDGFWRTDIRLKPASGKVALQELVVDIPFAKAAATYYSRGFSYDYVKQANSSPSWRGELGQTTGRVTGDREEPFVFHYWMGNEERGAELNLPSNFHWSTAKGESAIQVRVQGDATVLRLNMVNQTRALAEEAYYTFALLPTPVKPAPLKDYRRRVLLPSTVRDNANRALNQALWDFYPIVFHGTLTFENWGLPWPAKEPKKRAAFDAQMATAAQNKLQVIPYSAACLMSTNAPGFEQYRPYWVTSPEHNKKGMRDNVMVSLYAKSVRDFLVYQHVESAKAHPFYAGLYFDVADISDNVVNPNANDYDMAKHPAAVFKPIYEMRDFYQRNYKAVKAVRPDYVFTMHQAKAQDIFATYTDIMLTGEGLNATFFDAGRKLEAEKKLAAGQPPYLPDYTMFPEGFWKASYAWKGYLQVFLPMVTKTFPTNARGLEKREQQWKDWFGEHPEFVTQHTREMFAHTLPLDLPCRKERCDPALWLAVMKAFEQIGGLSDATIHVPYWQAHTFVQAEDPALLFTAYHQAGGKQALVIGANWAKEPARKRVKLEAGALGLAGSGPRRIKDLEGRAAPGFERGMLELDIPGNDFRLWLVE